MADRSASPSSDGRVTVRVPTALRESVDARAARAGVSTSDMIREMLAYADAKMPAPRSG